MLRNPDGIFPQLYKILEYMELHEILPEGAGQNRAKLRKDIEEYHTAYAIDFDDTT
jgi:hypothetical protein